MPITEEEKKEQFLHDLKAVAQCLNGIKQLANAVQEKLDNLWETYEKLK